jgi:hypothetical protein
MTDQAPKHITYNPGYKVTYEGSDPSRGYVYVRENTRPAAPVEGLETKGWEVKRYNNGGHWLGTSLYIVEPSISSAARTDVEELVTRSQAEAIIAAKDVLLHISKQWAQDQENRANRLQADNAALTARVKELEHDLNGAKGNAKNALSDLDYWRGQTEALEAQLAAAKETAARAAYRACAETCHVSLGHAAADAVRAALEAKP